MKKPLSQEEKEYLIQIGSNTSTPYPKDHTVYQLFEAIAAECGSQFALSSSEGTLVYAELNSKANQLARHLQTIGVKKGSYVGLSCERSLEMIIGILGILKIGAAYIPLDSSYPQERKRFMIEDSGISFLVTQKKFENEFPSDLLHFVFLDSEHEKLKQYQSTNLNCEGSSLDVACVYYTSGSTGKPKGVKIPHRGIVRLVRNINWVLIDSKDRFLQLQNISFDGATFEIWGALLNGAMLDIYPPGKLSLEHLANHILQKKISLLVLTSRLFNLMIEEQLESLKNLRLLCVGGEAMSSHHARIAFQALTSCEIVNGYGPTENTTITTTYRIHDLKSIAKEVPIGKPISNTTVYILDDYFQLVPKGIPGELYTGGDGLSLGYLNREELTQEKFISNPFGEGYLYRTGDLAYFQEDDQIVYCGRADDQVKIRGFRIELGEIEETLRTHPDIVDCSVIAKQGLNSQLQVLAYVQPKAKEQIDAESLIEFLKTKLPEYMIPAHVACIPKLPLTQNGKIDRKALPSIQEKRSPSDAIFNTSMEQLVASLWTELFGWKDVGPKNHFFKMGGDSLGAMKILSKLRKLLSIDISIDLLFHHPILADFAYQLEQDHFKPLNQIQPRTVKNQFPLSYNQEALWIEDRLMPGSINYAIPFAFHLDGKIDKAKLKSALDRIVQNHEILRTRYNLSGQQVIDDKIDSILHWIVTANKEESMQLLQEKATVPFNLETGPLIAFYIFQMTDTEHLALFYTHHIIMDDFAVQQFFKELASYYSSTLTPSPPPIQYGDFAIWQRDFLQTESARKQIEYWKKQLNHALELLEMPWDKPRPLQLSRKGRTCKIQLDSTLNVKLDELAKNQSVSKFTVLLTIYFVLLYRYSGKHDLLVGTPFANRNRFELESLIGFCSQMMVIRADLSKNLSFSLLLQQVNKLVIEAQENVDIPFEKLISELNPPRHSSYNPIFQVGFGLENLDDLKLELDGIEIKEIDVKNIAAKFDLFLTIKKAANDLTCHLEYSSDLFEEETIFRMLNHYASLIVSVVDQIEQGVDVIPILTKDEASKILVKWNQTHQPYPHQTIHRRFEEIAAQYPDNQAIRYCSQSISYQAINEKANQLARYLLSFGVKKGECIAVAFDRCPDLIIALLAILKVGAVFVPIDSSYPAERRDYILEDSTIKIVLAQSSYQDLYPEKTVCTFENLEASIDTTNLSIDSEFTHLSHIFYTSGSTGKPKGVELTHQGVLSLVSNSTWFPITPKDVVLQFSNISFDLMILEIFGALLNGAALCIYPKKEISLCELGSLLLSEKITHAIFTPRVLNLMVEDQLFAMKSLHYLVSAGEAMSAYHAKLAYDTLPKCTIINGYGPTETNFATAYPILNIDSTDTYIPIGKPLANTTTYLLNDFLQPVAIGVTGELYIGGDGVALGYQNRPDLTEQRFIPNPFGTGYLYRTGDLCRFTNDGNLIFIARKDTQVKLRGFRVELGEIEEVLRSHPLIHDCFVLVKDDVLIAYIAKEKGKSIDVDSLQEYVSAKLPAYMVPNSLITLDHLPLTYNGKIDIKQLPTLMKTRTKNKKSSLKTSTEKTIAQIWSQVLNIQDIQADDHFFKLGGSSIHAIQVVSIVKKTLEVDVSMNFIFQYPILKDFASHLNKREKKQVQNKITKRKLNEVVRIPWNQESFWQIDLMIPNSSNYTMFMCFQLDGKVHIPSMKKAVNKIISRHEALRTRFEDAGEYRIQIIEEGELDVFHFVDLSNKPNAEEKGMQLLNEIFQVPFDLRKLPLIQVHLIQLGEDKFLGAVYVHHIVFDGWSIGVFFKEWRSWYRAYLHDKPIEEPNPLIQHPDFACWHHEFLKTKAAQKQIAYWKKQIQGTKLIPLPWDFPRRERFMGGGGMIQWALPEDLSTILKKTAKELGVTLYELMLAAYMVLLYGYSGQSDLLVGSPFANRTQEELEPLLGFFIHMFAIRAQVKGNHLFDTLLNQISKTMAQAYKNSHIPCETIFAQLYPDWNPTFNRFQVGFSLDTIEATEDDFEKIKTTYLPSTSCGGKFDFYLGVIVQFKTIYFNMYYCSDLYLKETVEKLLTHFQKLLCDITLNPKAKINHLIKNIE